VPFTSQGSARVRIEWGPVAVEAVPADVVVVVDVLRFTTAVDVAVGRGATVFPYRFRDASAAAFAASVDAQLAEGDGHAELSLSPARLSRLEPGARIVLPSPNGSTCATLASERGATVVAACLRNARAVAAWVDRRPGAVTVVPCGERWPDGSLRPALEDLLGAAAVIRGLSGSKSAEATAAEELGAAVSDRVEELVRGCASGVEQVERDWADDLELAVQVDASESVPLLVDGAFVDGADVEG
jgi:2-phosphosulfolactate phosphatase